jgi:hypothetical protein
MTSWLSIAQTPPSMVYPPDNVSKWFARTDIPNALHTTAAGRDLTIIELRGWLVGLASECNASDPDWGYQLELDPEWLSGLGVSPSDLVRPGDLLGSPDGDPSRARQRSGVVVFDVELDAWQRHDVHRGQPPKPADWTFSLGGECGDSGAIWPFDPRKDVHGVTLTVGQYVRMVGSLVTDEPHDKEAAPRTNEVLRLGLPAASLLMSPADLVVAAANAAKWIWMESVPDENPTNPARWNEIHSPDYIEVLGNKERSRQLYQVVVCAQNGLLSGDVERTAIELHGPPRRPPNTLLRWRQFASTWTLSDTVKEGPFITPADDHITVNVTVQGAAGLGSSGKYAELFELWWEVSLAHLSVAPVTVAVDKPVTLTVTAVNADTGAPVNGGVDFDGKRVGTTGSPFGWTFGTHVEWEIEWDPRGKPHRVSFRSVDPVEAVVVAEGYYDARIPMLFTGVKGRNTNDS